MRTTTASSKMMGRLTNDDFLDALEMTLQKLGRDKIGNVRIAEIKDEEKWSITVLRDSQNTVGKAFNFSGDHAVYGNLKAGFDCGRIAAMKGLTAGEAVRKLAEENGILQRSYILSILNALSGLTADYENYITMGETEKLIENETVTLIGYNPPMVERFGQRAKKLYVSDMRDVRKISEETCGTGAVIVPSQWNKKVLEKSSVVVFTGCTLVNKTYLDVLEWSKNCKEKIIFGPSARILPEFLIKSGVTHIMTHCNMQQTGNTHC